MSVESDDDLLAEGDALAMRRLRWRCRRGMRELDILLGRYLDHRWSTAERAERASFLRLLAIEDDRLWRWISGREAIPDTELARLVAVLRDGPVPIEPGVDRAS
ncbi:MAG TPA: hypothetical protein DDZ76_03100 [Xanthomonadales bacterium]|nr:hypothetical protein [Xanthomonadales bacterium]